MAIALAPSIRPRRPSSDTAAAANPGEWTDTSGGAMAIIGWMVGTSALTLPTSLEPSAVPLADSSCRPNVDMLVENIFISAGLVLSGA